MFIRKFFAGASWTPLCSCLSIFFLTMGPEKPALPTTTYLPEVTSANGTATTQIPIDLPPGFAPQLTLVYQAGSSGDMLGKGWSLNGLDAVYRDPSTQNYNDTDRFLTPDGTMIHDGSVYRGKDNPHNQYQFSGSAADPSEFIATTPNGTNRFYGGTSATTVQANAGPGAYTWLLRRVEDSVGNHYTIEYSLNNGSSFPARIQYSSAGGSSREVDFEYESRPDAVPGYTWRGSVASSLRIRRIIVTSAGSLYRRYQFQYDQSPHAGHSRLTGITAETGDGTELFSQNFFYNNTPPGLGGVGPVFNHGGGWPASQIKYIDANGDGRVDILHQNVLNSFYVALSNGAGFSSARLWAQHGSGAYNPIGGGFADVNGDGRTDLIYRSTDNHFVVSLSDGTRFAGGSEWARHGGPVLAGQAQYPDVNGDGLADLVYQGHDNVFHVSVSDGTRFVNGSAWASHSGSFRAGQAQFVDLNGDGKDDLIFHSNSNEFIVSLSDGHRFVGDSVWMSHGGNFDPGQAQFADVNGDGLIDLIFQGYDNAFIVSLSDGTRFVNAIGWIQHSGGFIPGRARYIDVNADGMADLVYQGDDNSFNVAISDGNRFVNAGVWMKHGGPPTTEQVSYGDINGDGRAELIYHGSTEIMANFGLGSSADLLQSIDNGHARLELEYRTTANYPGLLQPQRNAPRRIANAAPHVLNAINRYVGNTPLARSEFEYAHGVYYLASDSNDRRHLGFETIRNRQYVYNGGWQQQPTFSTTNFDQNEAGSQPLNQETRLLNGALIARTTSLYETRAAPYPGVRELRVLRQQTTEQYSISGVLQKQTRKTLSDFDVRGQPGTIVDEGNLAASGDDIRTSIIYDSCAPGRPAVATRYDSTSTLIQRTETQYDAHCRPFQSTKGFNGNTSRTTITYADDGRPATITRDGLTETITYSGESTTVTAPDGTTKTTSVDAKTGLPVASTDAHNNTTVIEYDEFNRTVRKCTGTTSLCALNPIKQETNFDLLTPSGGDITISDSIGRSQTVTLDDQGRTTGTSTEDDRGPISTSQTFDSFNRALETTISGISHQKNTYDTHGQLVRVDTPGPNGTIQTNPDTDPDPVTVGNRAGLEFTITDAMGQTIYEVRDGKLLLQRDYPTEANGVAIWGRDRWTYNSRGLPIKIQRGYGSTRNAIPFDLRYEINLTYDELGRKTSQTEPNKGTISYAYNSFGKLAHKLYPDGTSIFYEYNSTGQLIQQRHGTDIIASYTYKNGKPGTIVDDSGTRTFYYDSRGRLIRLARTFETDKVFDVTYEYDEHNRPVRKRFDGSNLELEYSYFNTGSLKSITLNDPDNHTGTEDSRVLLRYEDLNQHNKPQKVIYGNGVEIEYEYQAETGLLTSMRAENGDLLADLNYNYRNDALLAAITDNHDIHSESYTYDPAHRLKEATGPYGDEITPTRTVSYRYAADGQLIRNGENDSNQNYTGSKPHQLMNSDYGLAYEYNTRGSVSQKRNDGNQVAISYNYLNRPDQIDVQDVEGKTSTTHFSYSDRGQRFKKEYTGESQNIDTYYLDAGYQVRIKGASELHTLIVRKPDGLLATLSFELHQFNASAGYSEIYLGRAIAVSGIGLTAWQERGKNLRQFFHNWMYTNQFLLILGIFSILIGILGISQNFCSILRKNTYRINNLLSQPRRIIALATTQILFANLIFLPALGCVNNSITIPDSIDDLTGNNYFLSNHLRSNFLVLNDKGLAVTKYVYLPYGKLNDSLTNEDLDGDGISFQTTEKYTGSEFDYESGLYNYNARIYDPETARFLQADPKHKDMPGWSNFDRYSYVHGNPINMIDPSGEIAWQVWAQTAVALNKGDVGKTFKGFQSHVNTFNRTAFKFAKKFGDGLKKYPGLLGFKGAQNVLRIAGTHIGGSAHKISSGGTWERHKARNDLAKLCENALGSCTGARFAEVAWTAAMVGLLIYSGIGLVGILGGVFGSSFLATTALMGIGAVSVYAFGYASGYVFGYIYGGLQASTISRLDWNEERARWYSKVGSEGLSRLYLSSMGNMGLDIVGLPPYPNSIVSVGGTASQLTSENLLDKYRKKTWIDHGAGGARLSYSLSEKDVKIKAALYFGGFLK